MLDMFGLRKYLKVQLEMSSKSPGPKAWERNV